MQGIVNIKGKPYVTVAERVRIAHEQKRFEIIESCVIQVADRLMWRAVINVDDKQYIGHAEVHFDVPENLPEGKSPLETAETSAVGRALGFAGLGVVESIASADEVARVKSAKPQQPLPSQVNTLRMMYVKLNKTVPDFSAWTYDQAATTIKQLQDEYRQLQQKGA